MTAGPVRQRGAKGSTSRLVLCIMMAKVHTCWLCLPTAVWIVSCLEDALMRLRLALLIGVCTGFPCSFLIASDDVHLVPAPDPQLVVDAKGFSGVPVVALSVSPDGTLLAAAGGKQVRIWDLKTGILRKTLRGYQYPGAHKIGRINDVTFSPCGRFLLVGVSDNTELGSTRVYALDDLSRIYGVVRGHTGCTKGIAFTPDGNYLATYGCDGHVYIYSWRNGQAEQVLDVDNIYEKEVQVDDMPHDYFGFPVDSNWLVLRSPCTGKLVISVSEGRAMSKGSDRASWPPEIRDLERIEDSHLASQRTGHPMWTTGSWIHGGGDCWYARGWMTQNGTESTDYWIGLWSRRSPTPVTLYGKHRYLPTAVSYSEKAGVVASADAIGEVHVWDAATGEQIYYFRPRNRQVYGVAWSDNGDSITFADEPYSQQEFNYNRCGPLTQRFDLQRFLETSTEKLPDRPVYPRKWGGSSYGELALTRSPNPRAAGVTDLLITRNGEPYCRYSGSSFGDPHSFLFASDRLMLGRNCGFFVGSTFGELALVEIPKPIERQEYCKTLRTYLGHRNTITAIEESPNGRLLATSSIDGTIRIWPTSLPRDQADLDVVVDGNRVASVPPGSRGAAGGMMVNDEILAFDGRPYYSRVARMLQGEFFVGQQVELQVRREGILKTLKVQLVKQPPIVEPILNLFLAEDGEWVAWTHGGYYNASSRGGQYVGWHVNRQRQMPADFYRVDQFEPYLYRPDVIAEVIRRGSSEGIQAVARQGWDPPASMPTTPVDFADHRQFSEYQPPQIRFIQPDVGETTHEQSLEVRTEIGNIPNVELRNVSLHVNGRRAGRPVGQESHSDGTLVWTSYSQTVDLDPGENQIVVKAENSKSLSASQEILIRRLGTPHGISSGDQLPDLYVLAVGISKYKNAAYNLDYAHRDAIDFAEAWQRQEGRMYRRVIARVLTNEEATKGNIADAMDWVTHQVNPEKDVVLVLFSGHGAFVSGSQWHLIPYDFDPNSTKRTAISHSAITDWIEEEVAANAVLFVDTCHSGGIHGTKGLQVVAPMGREHWQGTGTLIFASSLNSEVSVERESWKHGAFTQAILDTLGDPDSDVDRDGNLTFTELELAVKIRVRKMTGNEQNPTAYKPMTVSEVNLAMVP